MSSKRGKPNSARRSNSDALRQLSDAMESQPRPAGQRHIHTRDLIEDMPLAHNESISDPTMLDDTDFDIDAYIDKLPPVYGDSEEGDAKGGDAKDFMAKNPFVADGSPVEIVLIDRSKSKDSVRKLRIDENMNVSYWKADNKTKNIVVGIVMFSLVVLITGFTVIFAGRKHIDHEGEYSMLVESMDRSISRIKASPPAGWDIWQVMLPTSVGHVNSTHALEGLAYNDRDAMSADDQSTNANSYTAFVIVSRSHEDRWMKAKNSVLLTYVKGSQVQIIANIFKGQRLFSQETFYLGDTYVHGHSVYITAPVMLPREENFTLYMKVTIAADGYQVYSMIIVHSMEDVASRLLTENDVTNDVLELPLSQSWTDELNCNGTVLC